jgi:hypothetical protein
VLISNKHDAYTHHWQIGWKWVLLVLPLERSTMAPAQEHQVCHGYRIVINIYEMLRESDGDKLNGIFSHSLAVSLVALAMSHS